MDFLNEGVDWCVDVSPHFTLIVVSIWDVNGLHHLPSLLGDEGEIWRSTFLGLMVDDNDIHITCSIQYMLPWVLHNQQHMLHLQ